MPLLDPNDARPLHFMGVAGAGMNALAELALRRGARASGCDLQLAGVETLVRLGAQLWPGHEPAHVDGARAVIVSSAVPKSHAELRRAVQLGIPVVRRAEALAELTRGGTLVGIAGTHGKTTTTVMTTLALEHAGVAPTGVVGGRVAAWGGNLHPGSDSLFVVEADEYDRSFLALTPDIAVVTNVEADHLDIYQDVRSVLSAFEEFVSRAKVVVLCGDDSGACSLRLPAGVRRIAYGAEESGDGSTTLRDGGSSPPDVLARDVVFANGGSRFVVWSDRGATRLGEVELRVPGMHNVRNALAALVAGIEAGGQFDALSDGLRGFTGVERRFQFIGEHAGVIVIDDYAHHPTEIAATLAAARTVYPDSRIVAAFQPHLFTRTRDFADDFAAALAAADAVFLTDIYPAREQPIPGVSSDLIANALATAGAGSRLNWRGARDQLAVALAEFVRAGDVVLALGAGDITRTPAELLGLIRGAT